MHCLHFRWRNINNKTIMSRFWPNSKPNIFVTGKFLIYIFIVNESRIALGPVNGAHFPCLVPSLETETWIESVDIITHFDSSRSYNISVLIFQKTCCLNLDKDQKMSQEIQSSMFRSVVTVLRVSRIMSQLWTIHLRISKGNIWEAFVEIFFTA